ncbi:TetR/AcrR family transcriptional regulator [Streptomyces sp. R-74717]|uniref:TetR/AcrR family transcriptional regulator n=1 Tax=Streptomyces TaxID=1883 RepID=UPI0037ABC3A4
MTEGMSLRERKKLQTRHRLLTAATALFAERGFDKVSVAEIAEAAEVSKMTVFNYFAGKEDLVLAPMEEHIGDVARVVRDRGPGESAVAAVRRQFLTAIEARDPSAGLSDAPVVLGLRRLIQETPALLIRAHAFSMRSFDLLAEVLVEEGEEPSIARIAAAQLIVTRNALISANQMRLLAGESADAVAPDAVALAERGFDLLDKGLGGFATRSRGSRSDGAQGLSDPEPLDTP